MSPRLAGVIGSPVSHSLSPAIHAAAYEALGLDWVYGAFEVAPESFPAAVAGAGALGFVGLSVTMPHKEQAAALAKRRSRVARKLGAANTLTFRAGEAEADSTDGQGLLDDLREALGFDAFAKRCAVIGAGGAARAVVLALAEAGAAEVAVVNRTPARAFRAAALAGGRGRVARPEEIGQMDLVVQATPAEMLAAGEDAAWANWPAGADPSLISTGQLAVDLLYSPAESRWLAEAGRSGAEIRNGLGMLVHQAARQVAIWSGTKAPLEAMWAAARA